jgi:hypothetical protein
MPKVMPAYSGRPYTLDLADPVQRRTAADLVVLRQSVGVKAWAPGATLDRKTVTAAKLAAWCEGAGGGDVGGLGWGLADCHVIVHCLCSRLT